MKIVIPAADMERQGNAVSWRFEILKRLPGVLSALILLKRERYVRRRYLEKLGFTTESIGLMRAAKVLAFHDVRMMASYFCSFGKTPGQTVLLMSHAGSGLSTEAVKNWCIYMKETAVWDKIYGRLLDDEIRTILLADGLIVPYREAMEFLLIDHPERSLLLAKPIFEVPTGVPALKTTKDREWVLRDLAISPDKAVVGFFGRHHFDKGYDHFCDCAARAMTNGSNQLFFLTGGSGPIRSPELPNFKNLGYVTSQLANVMGAVDLVVSPSRVSYFEMSILEAMSLGKPIIASKIGGSRRLNSPGVFLMEDVSGHLLLDQITQLTSDMSALRRVGEKNLVVYQREYDLASFARRHVELAEKLLGQMTPRAGPHAKMDAGHNQEHVEG